ncbi:carotenoid biosynthesis protein [Paenibacillus sp. PDC88]|uniref:carotenoid biosynthesis protein n=1 Tax=Paenibacillus sp. PDC88 TaxID=1884375 RepID=UPI0008981021|nr:carotenoid biosynthesis protein [Paenibacillus sp. PDC88]SDW85362.1 putative membrane protein [Paenibacillus sp. PDC88]
MIQIVYWIWYSIGAVLLLTIGVPEYLNFSNGLFLVFYALCALSLVFGRQLNPAMSNQPHEWWRRPAVWLIAFLMWLGGMGVEWLGVHSGWPFGEYSYSFLFGFHVFSVPFTLGFAWIAVVGNAALLSGGGHGVRGRLIRALKVGTWALVMDLVLDPVMHQREFWSWEGVGGFYGVPWTNFASWFIMGAILSLLLPPIDYNPSLQRRGKLLYQMFILLFGLLALQDGLYGSTIIAAVAIFVAEGSHQYAVRKQVPIL